MRLRLILSFVLVVTLSVVSVVLVARQSAANEVRSFMYQGSMSGLTGIAADLEEYYRLNDSWQGAESLLPQGVHGQGMMGQGGVMGQRFVLADAGGVILADSAGAATGEALTSSELNSAIALESGGKTVGYLFAQGGMGFGRNEERQLMSRLNLSALTAGLVSGGASLLLALFLAYGLLRPVSELTRAAGSMAEGDLSQRVVVHGNDELAALGHTFNRMADSLQRSEESRQSMTADIAHELRTPLAVQRANLEALQDGIYPLTAENLRPVLEQNQLLTRLVDDLRTLSLADAGQLTLECTAVDLPALVERIADRFTPQALEQSVTLVVEQATGPGLPLLNLDPLRVEQILNNLLSNALRFTPHGGKIVLEVASRPGAALVTVHDSGPGIPQDSLPDIFERFYRVDRSRSRQEGGSGLGLAIARHLALAQGGTLTASNHPQGGAVFALSFPVLQGQSSGR